MTPLTLTTFFTRAENKLSTFSRTKGLKEKTKYKTDRNNLNTVFVTSIPYIRIEMLKIDVYDNLNLLPFIPNVGPCDGCLTHAKTFFFKWAPKAWANPIVVVLFPSPRGVGVILVEINFIIKVRLTSILWTGGIMLAPRARGPWFDPRCKLNK